MAATLTLTFSDRSVGATYTSVKQKQEAHPSTLQDSASRWPSAPLIPTGNFDTRGPLACLSSSGPSLLEGGENLSKQGPHFAGRSDSMLAAICSLSVSSWYDNFPKPKLETSHTCFSLAAESGLMGLAWGTWARRRLTIAGARTLHLLGSNVSVRRLSSPLIRCDSFLARSA